MPIKVAVFCGGRGSATIIRALLKSADVQLALLVNAYDDGLSTGALRDFIPGMLGPSDFRKNFSYLLDLYSDEQYALKSLVEFRLPMTFGPVEAAELRNFVQRGESRALADPLGGLIVRLSESASRQVRHLLGVFLDYADASGRIFEFRDCAVGNLLFAGAFLCQGRNFNSAAEVMSRLVSSQAVLVNVSNGENRTLVALKESGEVLRHEVEIVGPQSATRIRKLFFLREQIDDEELAELNQCKVIEKYKWLVQRQSLPVLSEEARRFLHDAYIIIYGPGTQHSSLLPSYMIAASVLKASRAAIKAMVVNLGPDHDIQGFKASDLVDRALACMGDPDNSQRAITHIVLDNSRPVEGVLRLQPGLLSTYPAYKGAALIRGDFENKVSPEVHNGRAVVAKILNLWERDGALDENPSLEIFYDLSQRSAAGPSLIEEFLELDWNYTFRRGRAAGPGRNAGAPVASASSRDRAVAIRGIISRGCRHRPLVARGRQRLSGDDYGRRRIPVTRHRFRGSGARAEFLRYGLRVTYAEPPAIQFLATRGLWRTWLRVSCQPHWSLCTQHALCGAFRNDLLRSNKWLPDLSAREAPAAG
jgi:2-phospho-L-lactate transferase/gluconeogenesis factor (CofD/UPF0052 family)